MTAKVGKSFRTLGSLSEIWGIALDLRVHSGFGGARPGFGNLRKIINYRT